MGPVLLVADSDLQERPLAADFKLRIRKLALSAPPQGDSAAITDVARMLVAAENPVIVADRCARTPAGLTSLVELAETLQAAVVDQGGRMNFPSRHPLNQSSSSRAAIGAADVILGLELTDFWGTVNTFRDQLQRSSRSVLKSGAKTIAISTRDLGIKANYQEFQRYPELDLAVTGDAEATLPSLVEAAERLLPPARPRAVEPPREKRAAADRASPAQAAGDGPRARAGGRRATARLVV